MYVFVYSGEIVYVQGMIEEIHKRWLDQEEEYMQEQRSFNQTTSSYNTVSLLANIFTS